MDGGPRHKIIKIDRELGRGIFETKAVDRLYSVYHLRKSHKHPNNHDCDESSKHNLVDDSLYDNSWYEEMDLDIQKAENNIWN